MLLRLIRHILAMVFGIIPENTDRPDYKERRRMIMQQREEKNREKEERTKMEMYYKKYAQTFKYRTLRKIQDRKFQRKRMKAMKSKPRPVYKPTLTPEQQISVQKQMQALYKEYHVSVFEHIRRWFEEQHQHYKNLREQFDEDDKKLLIKTGNIILAVLIGIAVCFSVYVTFCTVTGKPASVFGYRILKVETGSMEPVLHVGDCIIIKSCDTETLSTGDIISFYSEQSDIKGMLVTHRITAVNSDGTFITKGDANPVSDSLAGEPDSILGTYVRKSEIYRFLGSFTDSHKLFLLLVMITLTLVSLYELRTLIKVGKEVHEESEEEKKIKAKADYERRMREAIEAEKKRLAEENYQPDDDEVNSS